MLVFVLVAIFSVGKGHELTNHSRTLFIDSFHTSFYDQLDMKLTPKQLMAIERQKDIDFTTLKRTRRMATPDDTDFWPYGVIPYEIDPRLYRQQQELVLKAMIMWQTNTCLRFRPMDIVSVKLQHILGHNASLNITIGEKGCSSYLGRYQKGQLVQLSSTCRFETILHELGHAIGFGHEHSRPDRDNFITIHPHEIKDYNNGVLANNFNIFKTKAGVILPYDLSSVMHYSAHTFAINGHALTITTTDPLQQLWIGQDTKPSFLDTKSVNMIYECNRHCKNPPQCKEPAYVGPQCQCICPDGFIGPRCDKVKNLNSDCGGLLTSRVGYIASPNYPNNYPNNEDCYWFIKGEVGSRIRLTFIDFQLERTCIPTESQRYCDHLDVRIYGTDKAGQRYGHVWNQGHVIDLNNTELMLHFMSDSSATAKGFMILYKIM